MPIAYFDCFSGASGDMILGALIDAGCPLAELQDVVLRFGIPGLALSAEPVKKQGIAATYAKVTVGPEAQKKHRHLPEIERIIDKAGLPDRVSARAKAVFRRLAEAEAAVHRTTPEKVHFHEVGAADAIVDVVCACAGLAALRIERVECSHVPTGSGTVTCEHGVMPVPAPATALLLKGVPLAACDEPGELTTPTGAAILTTICARFGTLPSMRIERVGCGAGTREGKTRPNLLRLIVGEAVIEAGSQPAERDTILVVEANLDDASGQMLGHACERLLEAGALDVFVAPVLMKKGRPGHLLTVLCEPADAARLEGLIFRETPTFGIRRHEATRSKLARGHETVQTPFGPIRVKVGRRADRIIQAWPEYEDCAAAAARAGVSLSRVQAEALAEWNRGQPRE